MKIYKHKMLYNILSGIELLIVTLIFTVCYIIMCSVPTSGDYTMKIIIMKIIAMVVMVILGKIEGLMDD